MMLDREEIKRMVRRALLAQMEKENGRPEKKILAVVPGLVFNLPEVAGCLNGKNIKSAVLQGAELPGVRRIDVKTDGQKALLAAGLAEYDEIILVTPSLALIHAIVMGKDDLFEAALVLRPLLWGREVSLLLDFQAPAFRRGTAMGRVADDLSALENMGVQIRSVAVQANDGAKAEMELVTERDVLDAVKSASGRIRIKRGAIVTQLARETAGELGVLIEE